MAGLTPTEIRTAIDLVRQIHATGITLVIVEHIMEVIVSLAERVVVFHQGREIARGTPREVTSNEQRDRGLSRQAPRAEAERGRGMSAPLLKVENLEVRYGDLIGVADVSLEVPAGQHRRAARLQRRRQDHDAQCHRRPGAGKRRPDHARGQRRHRAAGLRDRAQGPGPVAGRLAAVRAAERREQSAARRHAARRPVAHPANAGARLRASFPSSPSGAGSAPAPCRAASGRCWRSAAR